MPADQPTPPKPKLRWYQYRLRTLFVLTFLVAVVCSWFTTTMQKAWRQEGTRKMLYDLGYETQFDYDGDIFIGYHPRNRPYPAWLEDIFGFDYFYKVTAIGRPIEYWPNIHRNNLTDAKIGRVVELTALRDLNISNSKITDAGLESLRNLNQIRFLNLCNTSITDKGLGCLDNMNNLERLALNSTEISDNGLLHLRHMEKLRILDLDDTKVTDAGLKYLEQLTQLEFLSVRGTKLTDLGIEKLQKALPKCNVQHQNSLISN